MVTFSWEGIRFPRPASRIDPADSQPFSHRNFFLKLLILKKKTTMFPFSFSPWFRQRPEARLQEDDHNGHTEGTHFESVFKTRPQPLFLSI